MGDSRTGSLVSEKLLNVNVAAGPPGALRRVVLPDPGVHVPVMSPPTSLVTPLLSTLLFPDSSTPSISQSPSPSSKKANSAFAVAASVHTTPASANVPPATYAGVTFAHTAPMFCALNGALTQTHSFAGAWKRHWSPKNDAWISENTFVFVHPLSGSCSRSR